MENKTIVRGFHYQPHLSRIVLKDAAKAVKAEVLPQVVSSNRLDNQADGGKWPRWKKRAYLLAKAS